MYSPHIHVYKNPELLAQEAARQVTDIVNKVIANQGRFSVVLAGGSTPKRLHELLADTYKEQIDWSKVFVFFGDERFVAPYEADSNYGMADESLLSQVDIPEENVFPYVTVGISLQEAAKLYETELKRFFKDEPVDAPAFDLLMLGMGPDGHTASLFPNHPLLDDSSAAWVHSLEDSPKPPPQRLSLSLKAINSAKTIMLLAAGESKNDALKRVQAGEDLPIARLEPKENLLWLLDEAAAKGLNV